MHYPPLQAPCTQTSHTCCANTSCFHVLVRLCFIISISSINERHSIELVHFLAMLLFLRPLWLLCDALLSLNDAKQPQWTNTENVRTRMECRFYETSIIIRLCFFITAQHYNYSAVCVYFWLLVSISPQSLLSFVNT